VPRADIRQATSCARIERSFDFLAYRFSAELAVANKTAANLIK
jgi:hypothetical protein